jgi:DNA-binding transcriptional LysR family regulator
MLNTTHLQTFIAVIEAGSYSAAARRLHMTQPAVSHHIRTIEKELGDVRLFRRVGKRMVPTQVGEELLQATRDLLSMADQTVERIRTLSGQVAGRVVVGRSPAISERYLPGVLAQFHNAYPLVALRLVIGSGEALVDQLEQRQIDLALVDEQQRRRGLFSQLLGTHEIVAVAPRGHALLQQETVVPGMLREERLILPLEPSSLRRGIEEALRRRGDASLSLQIALETDDPVAALEAARSGLGVAFVPASLVPPNDGVAVLSVQGLQLTQEWHLLRSRERETSRAVRELASLISARWGVDWR